MGLLNDGKTKAARLSRGLPKNGLGKRKHKSAAKCPTAYKHNFEKRPQNHHMT
jgi:hypothetical protein